MTERQPTPAAQLATFLSRFPPEIVAMAKQCLTKLRKALPGSNQLVYDYRHAVVVSFSMSEHGYEGLVGLSVHPDRVKLFFNDAKSLPDPKGLLEGSGSKVRSVTLADASAIGKGDVHALLQAAIKQSGITFPRTGSNPLLIKSEKKKRRKTPRKTTRA